MRSPPDRRFEHTIEGERIIAAAPEAVWAVLSDFHHVDRWAPRVSRVVPVGESVGGLGMARRCDVRGLGRVDEVVNVWEAGRRLGYSVAPVGPIGPAQSLWALDPTADGVTRVILRLSYDMRFGALGKLLHGLLVGRLLSRGLSGALALLRRHVESGRDTRSVA